MWSVTPLVLKCHKDARYEQSRAWQLELGHGLRGPFMEFFCLIKLKLIPIWRLFCPVYKRLDQQEMDGQSIVTILHSWYTVSYFLLECWQYWIDHLRDVRDIWCEAYFIHTSLTVLWQKIEWRNVVMLWTGSCCGSVRKGCKNNNLKTEILTSRHYNQTFFYWKFKSLRIWGLIFWTHSVNHGPWRSVYAVTPTLQFWIHVIFPILNYVKWQWPIQGCKNRTGSDLQILINEKPRWKLAQPKDEERNKFDMI